MTSVEHLSGFELRIHRSLVTPILVAGVPRVLAITIGTLASAVGLGLQQWIAGLILWVAGHSIAVVGTRRDPDLPKILPRHLAKRGYWSC